jgi:hypothetical protein
MRYLIDPEFRTAKLQKPVRSFIPYAAELRRELSLRNLRWALDQGHAHEVSLGTVSAESSTARTKPATMATSSPLPTAASSRRLLGPVASPRSTPRPVAPCSAATPTAGSSTPPAAPRKLIERYRDIEAVFDIDELEILDGTVQSYQLIRGVLAAHASPGHRFCVLCDARRPDLITAWHRTLTTVKLYDLRCRLQLLTWQELAGALPGEIQSFLDVKFGIKYAS